MLHIAEFMTVAKSLPHLWQKVRKLLIPKLFLSYSCIFEKKNTYQSLVNRHHFFPKNNIVYYRPVYNDTIYSIHENGSIRVEFAVNFGDRTVPEKYRNGKEI